MSIYKLERGGRRTVLRPPVINFFAYTANSPVNFADPSGNTIVVVGDSTSWQMAMTYLCTSPEACKVIAELQQTPEVFILNILDGYDIDMLSGRWKIYWNPRRALCVKNGIQSPSIQLLHELTHALQWKHDRPRNEEEATKLTNPAAKQLGEPIRLNYRDAIGDSTWALPIPSSDKERCKCQEPHKSLK